jgi:hypothetical protein
MSLEVEDYSSKDEYCNKKDEDYTVDNWEEKIGDRGNMTGLPVHQHGGDALFVFTPQASAWPRSVLEARRTWETL